MHVLMLGWEFPPFISGGLGTACHGLTKALSALSTRITFVLPKPVGTEFTSHVKVLSPQSPIAAQGDRSPQSVASTYELTQDQDPAKFSNVTFKAVPARFVSPYGRGGLVGQSPIARAAASSTDRPVSVLSTTSNGDNGGSVANAPFTQYCGDLMLEARKYAALCVDLARGLDFDVVHAHDWLTFPAGMAVAAVSGKPLVVHVHSTEFDRSGEHVNQQVYDIERRGMHSAIRVIAVSHLTRSIVEHRYGVHADKIDVVYNGVENGKALPDPLQRAVIRRGDKIVLFLGRVTMQKGPEYFIKAAKKVLEKLDRVKFVMAGSGDRIKDIIELAAAEGIGQKILFTGFLSGPDVERVFKMADVYVMPSVSEPFGISPLEAISHDVPVIISKTSGVSEVLTHALKVDFWDTDEIANKILAVLKHPPLSATLREHADMEVRRLTWGDAAQKCASVYERAVSSMP
jgi:glycogen synthase